MILSWNRAMRQAKNLVVSAVGSLLLGAACVLALLLVTPAQPLVSNPGESGGRSLSQAIIAYGFLRWDYLDFDRLLTSSPNLPLAQNMKALDAALESLDCDIGKRMAGPHKALILPPFPFNQWIGFRRAGGRKSPEGGWLFVTQPIGTSPQRVLVVFSSASPEQTTVFWIEEADKGYVAKLLFDSFRKGKIGNESTLMGAATSIRFESDNDILLKDWGEPGIGPPESMRAGRVFRLNLLRDTVTLVSPGTSPQH